LTAELGNLLGKTQSGEAGGEPRAERCPGTTLLPDCIAEDLPDFLFRAVAVTASADLKLGLYVVVEVANQKLSHAAMIAR